MLMATAPMDEAVGSAPPGWGVNSSNSKRTTPSTKVMLWMPSAYAMLFMVNLAENAHCMNQR
jgi:hypothetical protein